MASAYSAIANGGFLLKPRLVKQILSYNGKIIFEEKPEVIRKIAEPSTMNSLKSILTQVVQKGTGKKAGIKGWSVAGKTGTAHKVIDGAYTDKYISNFAGFFPANNPQIVGVIILDEPKYGLHWGGYGAAPVFRRVMQRIINMDDSIQYHKPKVQSTDIILANESTRKIKNSIIPLSTVSNYPIYKDGTL